VLLSKYRSRGYVEPMVRLAMQMGAGGCDAPTTNGAMPTGVWR
jgi:hypothetical protein